jgi:hypothetical protein
VDVHAADSHPRRIKQTAKTAKSPKVNNDNRTLFVFVLLIAIYYQIQSQDQQARPPRPREYTHRTMKSEMT